MSKKESFWNLLDSSKPDIALVNETWLRQGILDSEVLPPDSEYNIYRKDRADGYGGVLIALKSDITSDPVEVPKPTTSTTCEILFRRIHASNNKYAIVASAYRPPRSTQEYALELLNTIKHVCIKYPKDTFIVGGDLNTPDISWSSNTISGNQYLKSINETILSIEEELGLTQIVDFPTRNENFLDLIFTNRPSFVNRCVSLPGISDHDTILMDTTISLNRQNPQKRTIQLWKKADIESIKQSATEFSKTFLQLEALKSLRRSPC